ncbi:glutamate receptor ionotropic, kainate 2-like isoform X2 [Pectinophora gossypiella]|uniref:glutamate receptor ionotropic, kainate 2-like isoform X2 n=1 Tax=Pectinophora gossypiella TaxID=13191 RepID=UPI00214EDA15|nr:glutamate receptor ionotropic, kainate 2-like isoform X2 [Pectinophora gossypiella]
MSRNLNLLVLCIILTYYISYVRGERAIGAIFENGTIFMKAAFLVAIQEVNKDQEDAFEPNMAEPPAGDLSSAETAMCGLLESNIFGIFGPPNRITLEHIQSIADSLEIPHIITYPMEKQDRNWFGVNLYPYHIAYSQVFTEIIEAKGWDEFTIIYEGAELLPFFDNILNMQDLDSGDRIVLNVVQLPEGDDFRTQIKQIKISGSVNYIVDCSIESLPLFLEQAQQVGIMSDEHSYIIMNPDFHIIDVDPYKHGGSNITGVRFFDKDLESVQEFKKSIIETARQLNEEEELSDELPEGGLTFELALIRDAVILYASAINTMELKEGPQLACDKDDTWPVGSTLVNHIKNMEFDGMTGLVKFDEEGFRSDFEIDVIELMGHGFDKVAKWTAEDGLVGSRTLIPVTEQEGSESMKGKHFIVLTALSAPYGMLKESSTKLEGNNRYEGFGIELIDELAKMNEFNYTFEIQADGVYGSLDKKTNKWNGMMEKVMDGRVDFAITDLTITAARQKAVDFTSPFMNLGITILYKKPSKQPPDLFSFISPFSYEVWGWVAGAYCGVSVLIFILGRMAPEEWQNPYPCIEEPETLDNQFTLANSFWFTLGSVLTQGSEIAPIAVSTRMAGSMWWFFTLIMESDNLLYHKMYEYMDSHPEYMTASNDEGLDRVKSNDENYAFLMESTSIEYMVERNCDVAQVGGLLDNKGYGIAMKKNSDYRQPMSESILQLQEEGKLTRMKDKWWKEKRGGGACADDDAGSGDAQPLVLANVGGVFIVLAAGSGMAVLCAFLEMIFDVWMISRKEKVSFREELIAELKFVLSFSGDVKPVRHREESSSGSGGSKKEEEEEDDRNEDPDPETPADAMDPIPPTPGSEKSHSHHTVHSRRQSNAMAGSRRLSNVTASRRPSNVAQMSRNRKYSGRHVI